MYMQRVLPPLFLLAKKPKTSRFARRRNKGIKNSKSVYRTRLIVAKPGPVPNPYESRDRPFRVVLSEKTTLGISTHARIRNDGAGYNASGAKVKNVK
jgi:hypothetical protein